MHYYWPGKSGTIPDAFAWFKKKFGVRPMIVVADVKDKTTRQLVRMYGGKKLRPFY